MAPPTDRKQILENFWKQIKDGKPIVGAGAGESVCCPSMCRLNSYTSTVGIGLSAKFVEAGGGDLIIIYNSGRFRMAGRGSLAGLMPYGNANDVVLEMANEVPPRREAYPRHRRGMLLGSVQRHVSILETAERPRIRRRAEFSDCWSD